jgi:hypothetical protein
MNKKSEKKYLLIFRHEYGYSHAVFTVNGFDPMKLMEEKELILLAKAVGFNYEPNKEEEMTIMGLEDIGSKNKPITKKDITGGTHA